MTTERLSAEKCLGCGLPVATDERWTAHDEQYEAAGECPIQAGTGTCWCEEWCWEDGRCSADGGDMRSEIDRLRAALAQAEQERGAAYHEGKETTTQAASIVLHTLDEWKARAEAAEARSLSPADWEAVRALVTACQASFMDPGAIPAHLRMPAEQDLIAALPAVVALLGRRS